MPMLPMFILHNIHQVEVEEIKAQEHVVYDQINNSKSTMSTFQCKLEEKENQMNQWQKYR